MNGKLYYIVFSLPIATLFFLLFPIYRIRLARLSSDRIGHYAMNTELFCCALRAKESKKRECFLFYNDVGHVSNQQLHRMYKRHIKVLPGCPHIWKQVNRLLCLFLRNKYQSEFKRKYESRSGYQDTEACLASIEKPLLAFTSEEINKGERLLAQLGLPKEARYVCLLVRDAEYLSKTYPERSWGYHNFRDANIETYQKAALYLAEKGYYVLRMGKEVKNQFDVSHPHVIDYANHALRSDFLDVYLSANCHFFISTCTGLDAVPQIFRRPVLLTNIAPFASQLQYWYPCKLLITKKVKSLRTGLWISFSEIYRLFGTYNGNMLVLLKQHDLVLVDNSEDEILEVVQEMEARMSGEEKETERDVILQEQFKSLLPFAMIPNNEVILENPERFYIRLGKQFLEENQAWIQ